MRILVTDAEYKLTLGIVRSLGARGATVVATAAHRRAQSFTSRHVAERLVGPPPSDESRFVDFVAEQARRVDVVLPVGQDATRALAHHREAIPAAMAVPPPAALHVADSKRRTIEFARAVGVATPRDATQFPAVAKRDVGSGDVRYVARADDVPGDDWLVQEYVEGEGRGFFALMDDGEERAVFMHRRLREYPVTGGASTAAESIDDPHLRELGLRLLRTLRWHGVAMVEFKHTPGGDYVLMEINPKFWGSIDLAIASGVDFPWLAVQLALGRSFEPVLTYRTGVRFQWVFSDALHVLARPRNAGPFARDLFRADNDLRLDDLRPNAREAAATLAGALRRARAGTLRRPHGEPPRRRTGSRT